VAKEPDKPARRNILTGAAQPVTDSVERARDYLKDRPESSRPPSTRKNRRRDPERKDEELGRQRDAPEPEDGSGEEEAAENNE
jgi:nucleoside-diphosphate-sugar epimerase